MSRKSDSYPSTRRRACHVTNSSRENRRAATCERRTRRTHVRVGRAGRQRTTAAHRRRRSPKSACPLSLMNLRHEERRLSSRGEKEGKAPVSCARFGTQREQTASPTGSLEPRSLRHSPRQRHTCSPVKLFFPLLPSSGSGPRGAFAQRSKEKAVGAARVLYGRRAFLFE